MSGTIGNCCKIEKNINAIINQRILKLSIKDYEQDTLCLIINSIVCKMQLEKIGTGGVQTNISPKDIFNIVIPILPIATQTQISSKIQQSFELKNQSKNLLDIAKQAVEMAIEQNEDIAMDWINIT
jgi:restriction endonuclease S subunit